MSEKHDMPWMATEFGWVFMGLEEPTDEDYQNLYDFMQSNDVTVDAFSLKGRWDKWWTAKIFIAGTTTSEKMGGLGSDTYETQKVGDGVHFRDEGEGPIWHYDPDGNRTHGVLNYPRTDRAYHVDEWGSTRAGPEPGSEAAERLGENGWYSWDAEQGWWEVVTP